MHAAAQMEDPEVHGALAWQQEIIDYTASQGWTAVGQGGQDNVLHSWLADRRSATAPPPPQPGAAAWACVRAGCACASCPSWELAAV